MLAATTDKVEDVKKVMSAAMRGLNTMLESTTGKPNATIATLGGQPETHILGETFYSQVPLLYGGYVAKVAVAPASPELKALTKSPLDVNGKPDGLREAVTEFFASQGGVWELQVQLRINAETMPVENAAKVWPEDESPYIPVGRITVKPQASWTPTKAKVVDEGYSFSPWHGLATHRPLGSVMRVRKAAYEAGARFRAQHNAVLIEEPTALDSTL
jgi:hypothetical protein